MRFGIGYDVHKLVEGRKLILGGVEIPFEKGLAGHSDADVLLHAIKDALLGAIGEGDIGRHFPDNDPTFKDISSRLLLSKVYGLLKNKGYRVNNIDTVIVAERPKLASYIPQMVENIATTLEVEQGFINVKATTTEGLGFTGLGQGISVHAIASVIKRT